MQTKEGKEQVHFFKMSSFYTLQKDEWVSDCIDSVDEKTCANLDEYRDVLLCHIYAQGSKCLPLVIRFAVRVWRVAWYTLNEQFSPSSTLRLLNSFPVSWREDHRRNWILKPSTLDNLIPHAGNTARLLKWALDHEEEYDQARLLMALLVILVQILMALGRPKSEPQRPVWLHEACLALEQVQKWTIRKDQDDLALSDIIRTTKAFMYMTMAEHWDETRNYVDACWAYSQARQLFPASFEPLCQTALGKISEISFLVDLHKQPPDFPRYQVSEKTKYHLSPAWTSATGSSLHPLELNQIQLKPVDEQWIPRRNG